MLDHHVVIRDPTSILPFTFEQQAAFWQDQFAVELLGQMKYPFENLTIELIKSQKLVWRPWMVNADALIFHETPQCQDWVELAKQIVSFIDACQFR